MIQEGRLRPHMATVAAPPESPDSTISVTGFEDEQVNWEANSALLGERFGPVRVIREVWGADSGTNTTKTEYCYRDFYVFGYHLRVHPIPPDELYTSWDHNAGKVTRYYNEGMTKTGRPGGVPIDRKNDDIGNIDSTPVRNNVTKIKGRDFRVRATLTDFAIGDPLAGKRIHFSRNTAVVASATTNSHGRATVTMRRVKNTLIAADFAGDDTYAASRAQRRL
ncbi:MAG TPA: Ig-like domain-containing protein [Actinomycetota bacterium]|nr:Ig-like domain-containing protein [Actinomycetota bacterium]